MLQASIDTSIVVHMRKLPRKFESHPCTNDLNSVYKTIGCCVSCVRQEESVLIHSLSLKAKFSIGPLSEQHLIYHDPWGSSMFAFAVLAFQPLENGPLQSCDARRPLVNRRRTPEPASADITISFSSNPIPCNPNVQRRPLK